MLYYLDSSALIKRYAPEAGSAWVKQIFDVKMASKAYFSQVTSVEIAAGLSRKVRTREISQRYYQLILKLFLNDLDRGDYQIVLISDEVVKLAVELTKRHPLRAYDALHLASAQRLNITLITAKLPLITFVSADRTLLDAAQME